MAEGLRRHHGTRSGAALPGREAIRRPRWPVRHVITWNKLRDVFFRVCVSAMCRKRRDCRRADADAVACCCDAVCRWGVTRQPARSSATTIPRDKFGGRESDDPSFRCLATGRQSLPPQACPLTRSDRAKKKGQNEAVTRTINFYLYMFNSWITLFGCSTLLCCRNTSVGERPRHRTVYSIYRTHPIDGGPGWR